LGGNQAPRNCGNRRNARDGARQKIKRKKGRKRDASHCGLYKKERGRGTRRRVVAGEVRVLIGKPEGGNLERVKGGDTSREFPEGQREKGGEGGTSSRRLRLKKEEVWNQTRQAVKAGKRRTAGVCGKKKKRSSRRKQKGRRQAKNSHGQPNRTCHRSTPRSDCGGVTGKNGLLYHPVRGTIPHVGTSRDQGRA